MTHTLQDKPSLVTVPFRQVVTKAGEITSTVQDTSTWTPLENGLNIKDGYLALSTSASTTVTNCETLYPQLWANAPTAWRSGSDLIIPAQGVPNTTDWIDYTNANYGGDFGNSTWNYLKYKKTGNTISLRGSLVAGSTFNPGSSLTLDLIPDGLSPLNPSNYLQIAGNVGYLKSGSNYGNGGYASLFQPVSDWLILFGRELATTNPFTWAAGDTIEFILQDIEIDEQGITPVISLFNNVASSSIGLPQADAEVSGLVTRNEVTEAGRNYIINGGFEFWQRETFDGSNPTTPTYLSDRWQIERQGDAGVNFLRDGNVPDAYFNYSIRLGHQSVPASSRSAVIWQRIPVDEYKHLLGKQVTISWRQAVTHTGGTTSVLVFQNTNVTKDVWGSENASETQIVNEVIPFAGAGAWEEKSYTFTIPETATTGIVIGFSSFIDNLSTVGSMFITGVKLEEGSAATKFTRAGMTYEGELALCQRYYEKSYNIDVAPGTVTFDSSVGAYGAEGINNGNAVSSARFSQLKRTTPTVVIYNPTNGGAAGQMRYNNSNLNVGASLAGQTGFLVTNDTGSDWPASTSSGGTFHFTADAEL